MSTPEGLQTPDYDAYTNKLLGQFEAMPPSTTFVGMSENEAISSIVSLVAGGFFQSIPKATHEPEYLSQWHMHVRAKCSDRYTALTAEQPGADRHTLNEDLELQRLNAVRRGLSLAVRRSYGRQLGTRRSRAPAQLQDER